MEARDGVDIATLTYLNPAPFFDLETPRWPVKEALLVYAPLGVGEDLMRVWEQKVLPVAREEGGQRLGVAEPRIGGPYYLQMRYVAALVVARGDILPVWQFLVRKTQAFAREVYDTLNDPSNFLVAELVREEIVDKVRYSPVGIYEVEDLKQYALEHLLGKVLVPGREATGNFKAYLKRAASRAALRLAEREGRRATIEVGQEEYERTIVGSEADLMEEMVLGAPTTGRILKLLYDEQVLTPRQRAVIVSRHYEGLTFAEIGRRLGISRQTAHEIYTSGLEKLRKSLLASAGVSGARTPSR